MDTLVVIVAVAVAAIVLLALLNLVGRNQPGLDRAYYLDSWQKIHIKSGAEETWALAVIDADKLLDHALRKKGFGGQTMAERMVSAKDVFTRRQLVWESHKFRNLAGFRSALKDLGAL